MIKVTATVNTDLATAHQIIENFAKAGVPCVLNFEILGTDTPTEGFQIKENLTENIDTLVTSPSNIVEIQSKEVVEPDKQQNFEYCAEKGIKEGAICYLNGITNSQGLIKKIADDYSMVLVKFSNASGPGYPATSHDVVSFQVKLGDKIKWVDITEISVGVKPQ